MTINILYSCSQCGIVKRSVIVNARTSEDVVDWMKIVIFNVSLDHQTNSPNCQAKTITEVMIPISGADQIGGSSIN